MKQTKKALAVLLAVLMLALSMPFAAFAEDATSGSCGDNATWSFDTESKTLTISGTGATYEFNTTGDAPPWQNYKRSIAKVVVEEGITVLSKQFMYNATALKSAELPSTLTTIGRQAFRGCSKLVTINLPLSLTKVFELAFEGCTSLAATYAGTAQDWEKVTLVSGCGLSAEEEGNVTCHIHAFSDPVFTWTDGGVSAATAVFTCTTCQAVLEPIDAVITGPQQTTDPGCETVGKNTYTATVTVTEEMKTYEEATIAKFDKESYTGTTTEDIDPVGHSDPLTAEPKVPATCTQPGTEAYWYCSTCGQKFSDAEGKNKIAEAVVIPALGHDFTAAENNANANQIDATHHNFACKNGCGAYGIGKGDTAVVAGTEECTFGDYDPATDTATCQNAGTISRFCTVCGNEDQKAVNRKNHDFENGAYVINDDGTHSKMCKYYGIDGCKQISTVKTQHDWGTGEVTTEPTCTKNGVKTFTCVCGETKTEQIDPKGHTLEEIEHETVNEDTHTVKANSICSVCGTGFLETKAGELKVTKEPTCNETGTGYYLVTFDTPELGTYAFPEITLPIDSTNHQLTAVKAQEADCTTGGWDAYWKCERCNKLFSDAAGETEIAQIPAIPANGHTEEVTIGYAATCTEAGLTDGIICSVCQTVIQEQTVIPAAGHTPGEAVVENNVAATCTQAGSYDSVVKCTVCGEEISRVKMTNALIPHTLEKTEKVEPTCTEDGTEAYWTCSVCEKLFSDKDGSGEIEAPVAITSLGHDFVTTGDNAVLKAEADYKHSYKCSRCDVYGATANCQFGEWKEDVEATCETGGTIVCACACGNKKTQSTDPLDHSFTGTPRDNGDGTHSYQCVNGCGAYSVERENHTFTLWGNNTATCTSAGTETRTCTKCGRVEENDTEMLPHNYRTPSYSSVKTESGYSVTANTFCRDCATPLSETVDAEVVTTEGKEPTCSAVGEGTYVAKFENEVFSEYTVLGEDGQPVTAEIAIDPDAHNLNAVQKLDPTCEEDGYEAYWQCTLCSKLFKAETATAADVIEAPIAIDALQHQWSDVTYTWAENNGTVTAERTCTRDNCGKKETETVNVTSSVTKDPTCTVKGETTYTSAAFTNPAFTAQAKTLDDIPAQGHTYAEPKDADWTWTKTANGYTATVKVTCIAEDDTQTLTATVTLTDSLAVGHLVNGYNTYTATAKINDQTFTATKTDTITAEGHTIVAVAAAAATCEKDGNKAYTYCSVCDVILTLAGRVVEEEGYTTTANADLYTLSALGHDWSEITYTWADDDSEVTAERTCQREGCDAEETETVAATGQETREANCVDAGIMTYTSAAFENEAFEIQEKDVSLGKDMTKHVGPFYWDSEDYVGPSYTEMGHYDEVYYCSACDNEVSRETHYIDVIPHNHEYTSVVTQEPNCTYEGVRTFTCQLCGAVRTENIPTNGKHADPGNDGYCDYCGKILTDEEGHCPQCGKIHNGGFGDKLTGFFHRIAAFFTRLFR